MVYVAVLGYGTVGSGVVEVIENNNKLVNKKAAEDVSVKYILDIREFPGDPYEDKIVHDFDIILNDPEVSIVCETMGGNEPAFTFSKKALMAGKSVCTSNKELVANHGPELLKLAREHKCNYLFEASVGGGIPIIRPLNYCLTAEKIEGITGILNGTTNYILTKMDKEGVSFETVLKKAQELGYAEKNPAADVEGYDACRKIAILSSLMSGKYVNYEDIYTEGITKITAQDFQYAKALNCSIKLLAQSRENEDGFFAMVAPCMISREHPLYMVSDVFNAVYVESNMLGETMYYGKGAGKLATASAVVSDVIDCARHQGKTVMCFWSDEKKVLTGIENAKRKFFVRIPAAQKDAAIALFGNVKEVNAGIDAEYAFVTEVLTEQEFEEKKNALGCVINRIRMEA